MSDHTESPATMKGPLQQLNFETGLHAQQMPGSETRSPTLNVSDCSSTSTQGGLYAHEKFSDDNLAHPYTTISPGHKVFIVIVVSLSGALAPFASNIFLPSLTDIAADLVSTVEEINVAVSVFMLGLAVAPVLWGPMADQFGRRYVYALSTLVCMAASIGCALATSAPMLLGMRFWQAFGGSCTMVIGAGTISDIYEPFQRGTAMGVYFGGSMFGPVLGTIIGGYLAEALGWRWTFWLTAILSGVFFALLTFAIPETHRGILARKCQILLKGLPADIHLQPAPQFSWRAMNVFSILPCLQFSYVLIPVVATAVVYSSYYAMTTAYSMLLRQEYHFATGTIGLCYLAIGAGNIVGCVVCGPAVDYTFNRRCHQLERAESDQVETGSTVGSMSPVDQPYEYRLPSVVVLTGLVPLGLAAFGWTMQFQTAVVFPLISGFFVGFGMNVLVSGASTYLIDVFTAKGASVVSVMTLIRSLYCALWTGVIELVMKSWGVGWAFTFLGLTCLVVTGALALLFVCGQRWRTARPPTQFLLSD
ncbi:hypothetical protein H4R34_004810 [Dimargaris verticillata]|uniref:Major facilitator superfamily (MFS) profile domain-containing protein n=1 Tax=Dimargaris verticillata TaxID=2761393 RepID=A0A9W8B3G9_9FUNG|nr:hypothetical protein H4R34_004810 [Dimargaris verticillata]